MGPADGIRALEQTKPQPDETGLRLIWVARGGVEPPTFRFSVGRSYQLSYLAEPETKTAGRTDRSTSSDPDGTRTRDLRRDRAAR